MDRSAAGTVPGRFAGCFRGHAAGNNEKAAGLGDGHVRAAAPTAKI